MKIVEDTYGGGTYNIHSAGSARTFKTYVLAGPTKFRPAGPQREKSRAQELKAEFEAKAFAYALEALDSDPELQRLVGFGMLKKYFGVEPPPEVDWKEQLVRKGVEGNLEYRDALVKAGLRQMGRSSQRN